MMEPSNPLELVKNMRKKMQPLSLSKCGFFHHGTPSSGRTLASSWPTDFSLAEDMFASSLKGGKESKAQGQVRTVQTTDRRLLFVDQPHRPESHEGIVAAADHVCISRVTGACKQQLFKDQNPPPKSPVHSHTHHRGRLENPSTAKRRQLHLGQTRSTTIASRSSPFELGRMDPLFSSHEDILQLIGYQAHEGPK